MNNITSTRLSSSNSIYMPPSRRSGVASHQGSEIRYNGNKPVGKKYRVRPIHKANTQQTEKTDSLWARGVNWVQTQARSLQQALKYIIESDPQDLPDSPEFALRYDLCVSGDEAAIVTLDPTYKRHVQILNIKNGTISSDANSSQAITSQLPSWGSPGEVNIACNRGTYDITSIPSTSSTILFHTRIINKTISVFEYIVAQMQATPAQPFRAAELPGDKAVVAIPLGSTYDLHLMETNQTGHFSGTGQPLNTRSPSVHLLSTTNGTVHIFQLSGGPNSHLNFSSPIVGFTHTNNQTEYLCQNTPSGESRIALIGETHLAGFDLNTHEIVSNRTFENVDIDDRRTIAEYGNGIWVYARTIKNITNGIKQLAYDFVDVTTMESVIGGEKVILINQVNPPEARLGVSSDGTVLLTYRNDEYKKRYITLLLVDDLPSPSVEIPSPVVPSPSIDVRGPSIVILPPINLNQTYVPITPEIIKLEGNIINITITDKKGYEFVFNANCSVVDECVPFTVTDLYQMSIALKNGTLDKVPHIDACSIDICAKSVADSQLQQQIRLDDKTWIIAVPVAGGVLVLIAIGGIVYYFKKVRKISDENQRRNEASAKGLNKTKDRMREIEQATLESKAKQTEREVAQATSTQTFQGSAKYNKKSGDIV